MARNAPRVIYGVHGVTPYSRTTGLPYGELRIVKTSSLSLQGELQELMGGSSKYAWAAEEGAITSELSINVGEIPNFMFTLFLGKAPTDGSAETTGNVSTLTDKNGTTVSDASNGISAVGVLTGSSANLKFGKYVVSAISATEFDVYYLTGIDLGRGTDGSFINDALKIASSQAFASGTLSLPDWGLIFTKAGIPAFTTGDSATFEVRPVNSGSSSVRVGGVIGTSFPEFGALVYAQKRGNQEMFELDIFRAKAAGMPIPFEMGAFAAYEIKAKCLYDESKDGIFDMRFVQPT